MTSMAHFPRGIAPDLLISQVKNTMPYLFEPATPQLESLFRYPPAQFVLGIQLDQPLEHLDYFKLCASAHYLTVATPVPTDVDNQIRQKLWDRALPLEIALQMADYVLESRSFDFSVATRRTACGAKGTPWENELLAGL